MDSTDGPATSELPIGLDSKSKDGASAIPLWYHSSNERARLRRATRDAVRPQLRNYSWWVALNCIRDNRLEGT